jgi:predicted enzyme related to lactoylglutathione lyase
MADARDPGPIDLRQAQSGSFCWLDLAARDVALAREFYGAAFGWTFTEETANGGRFTRLHAGGRPAGSLYQLRAALVDAGVPSHWTPYIRVDDADAALRRTAERGGRTLVAPFVVDGTARIALLEDAVGALIGLWQPLSGRERGASGG